MCWRDDVAMERYCSDCGRWYYGPLGCACYYRRKEELRAQHTSNQPEPKPEKKEDEEAPF